MEPEKISEQVRLDTIDGLNKYQSAIIDAQMIFVE